MNCAYFEESISTKRKLTFPLSLISLDVDIQVLLGDLQDSTIDPQTSVLAK